MNDDDHDIFISESIYPDVREVFTFKPKPISELRDNALIILDTNTLLLPYVIGPNSIKEIKSAYTKLLKQNRLYIPGQVVREFLDNRTNKIKELFQQFNRKKIKKYGNQGKYTLLEGIKEYEEVLEIEKKLSDLENEYSKATDKVLEIIQEWGWNDPVSSIYRQLFSKDVIYDPNLNHDHIQSELERRYGQKLPPGYKDSAKDDKGVGDLIIWFTILEIAGKQKKDVIFVSTDQKSDWWCRSEGQLLSPRFELIDEFRRKTNGHSLAIIKFSDFISLYTKNKETIEEVRKEEDQFLKVYGSPTNNFQNFAILAERAVFEWFSQKYGSKIRINENRNIHCDFIFDKGDGITVGIEVKVFKQFRVIYSRYRTWNLEAFYALEKNLLSEFILVLVAFDEFNQSTHENISLINKYKSSIEIPNVRIVYGEIENGKFHSIVKF